MENILDLIKVNKENYGKSNETSGNKFLIVMSYMNKQISFYYHDNYMNKSDKKDFLYALMSDSNAYRDTQNIDNFVDYFGYDTEKVSKVIEIFNGCKANYKKYNELFNEEEQNKIEELLQDY